MTTYSLKANLRLMLKLFYRPGSTISFFLERNSAFYWIVPISIATVLFFAYYLYAYLTNMPPYMHLFARLAHMPDHFYDLLQLFIFPVMNVVTFALFGILAYALSGGAISGLRSALFFAFAFGTVSIPAFLWENVGIFYFPLILNFSQPIVGIAYMALMMEFMHRQSGIPRWRCSIVSFVGVAAALSLRGFFLG